MQRKNNILKSSRNFRNGMAMIMAIVVLVVLATIMALSIALTTQTSKRTTDMYLYEQAVLLSQSSADYAMLEISQANPCSLSNIDFSYGGVPTVATDTKHIYDINITMKYIAFAGTACDGYNGAANTTYSKSDGTVMMDITVSTRTGIATEPIRYFRRSVQKM